MLIHINIEMGPQSNESFQITIEELKREMKQMKDRRFSGGIVPQLKKCGARYSDKYLLQIINTYR
jgi:hypothetical protein